MSLSNQQLTDKLIESELARTEQMDELADSYNYCEMVQDMNHELTMQNIQLNVLINSLNKKIKKGYLQ